MTAPKDDETPVVTPETLYRAVLREGLETRCRVSGLVSLEELQEANETGGETGMYNLIMDRWGE